MSSCLKLWLWNGFGSWGMDCWAGGVRGWRQLAEWASGWRGASKYPVLAGFSLSSHGATFGCGSSYDDAASCLHLAWVLNISGPVSFLMFVFKHRAASWEGRAILQYNQLLYVNIISKEVKGCDDKAKPLSQSAASSAPAVCPPACLAPSCWGMGHHMGWLGKTLF